MTAARYREGGLGARGSLIDMDARQYRENVMTAQGELLKGEGVLMQVKMLRSALLADRSTLATQPMTASVLLIKHWRRMMSLIYRHPQNLDAHDESGR